LKKLGRYINGRNYGRRMGVGVRLVDLEKGGRKPKVEGKKNY
jgi:hypothetical protein